MTISNRWLSKDNILPGYGIPSCYWELSINQLLANGLVERRGMRYRAVKTGGVE